MRVGIFGGTFDPVHSGHLVLAEQAREQAQLDAVWFVPAPRPPHKDAAVLARFDQRVEMIELAIAGNSAFAVDQMEKDRTGPSYTVDTLQALVERHPADEFFLLVGSDTLADLHTWKDPERVVHLAILTVLQRPGNPVLDAAELGRRLNLPAEMMVRLLTVSMPLFEVSSHDVRARIRAGRSVRYLLPRAVECYIHEKRLYRSSP
jgi:nicotinate-nucleotide adenylyltransferase